MKDIKMQLGEKREVGNFTFIYNQMHVIVVELASITDNEVCYIKMHENSQRYEVTFQEILKKFEFGHFEYCKAIINSSRHETSYMSYYETLTLLNAIKLELKEAK